MRMLRGAAACLLLATACSGRSSEAPSEVTSTAMLVRELQQRGATVSLAEVMPRDSFAFFSVDAQRLLVNGRSVHVFEYPDASAADRDAGRVTASGTPIGETQIAWVEPPRFYKSGRLIVLYVGRNNDVAARLEAILGLPFAGVR